MRILLGVLCVVGLLSAPLEAAPLNIVFVLADDLGYGDLGCYGHPRIKTPHLDRFALQGMRFTDCHSASSVCSPSRSAILTGRTPFRNGVFTWIPEGREIHLRTSEVTIATLLQKQGYDTCHVGKWHLNGHFNKPEHPQPIDHGYRHWFATQNNAGPSHKDPVNFARNGQAVGPLVGYSSQLVVDEGIRWLKEHRDPAKPFLLSVWTHEPHLPIESDPQYQTHYQDLEDPDHRQHHGNVTQLDAAFGRLMAALDELKLSENTLVIFTSDNGPEGDGKSKRTRGSTGGLRGRKRSMYEGGHRVAGIVRWPGRVEAGAVCDQPVIGSDWFVTMCEATQTPTPTDRVLDGTSVLPAFAGKTIDRKAPMYWRYHGMSEPMKMAMRVGDWKLLASRDQDQFELYNLRADRNEERDLASSEPERLKTMQTQLRTLNAQIEAEGPPWWKDYAGDGGPKGPAKKQNAKSAKATK